MFNETVTLYLHADDFIMPIFCTKLSTFSNLLSSFIASDWDKINKFSSDAGWDMVFDLNMILRNGSRWDPTNAIELMKYTTRKGYRIAGWEFGNGRYFLLYFCPRPWLVQAQDEYLPLHHVLHGVGLVLFWDASILIQQLRVYVNLAFPWARDPCGGFIKTID